MDPRPRYFHGKIRFSAFQSKDPWIVDTKMDEYDVGIGRNEESQILHDPKKNLTLMKGTCRSRGCGWEQLLQISFGTGFLLVRCSKWWAAWRRLALGYRAFSALEPVLAPTTYALHLEKTSILYGTGSILPYIHSMRLFRWAGNLRQGKTASR